MPERYVPQTAAEKKAYLAGQVVSAVQFAVQRYGDDTFRIELGHYPTRDLTYGIRLDYLAEDKAANVQVDRQWVDNSPDSGADSQQIADYYFDGHEVRQEGFLDHARIDGSLSMFVPNPMVRAYPDEYTSPPVTMETLKTLKDVVLSYIHREPLNKVTDLKLPASWPKVR